jgi:glucokinase
MKSVAIGIDIGGTNTKYGIADERGQILASSSLPTRKEDDFPAYIQHLEEALSALRSQLTEPIELKGIGIGAPNANYYQGTIEDAPNLIWEGILPIAAEFGKYYDVPVTVTNDANAAAMGEMIYGGAKGMHNFIMVTLGTGVGSGFIVNGDLVYGHDGFAGEFGHVITEWGGRPCTCGRQGCIETYASARGVVITVMEELAGSHSKCILRDLSREDITPKAVFEAAEQGDPVAIRTFERTGRYLGMALSNMVNVFSPEAIFLFGGVARAGQYLVEPTERHLNKHTMSIFRNKVKVIPSSLPESDAAILGASSLVWKELGMQAKTSTNS